jgi:signal transduction histidine kinase
VGVQLFTTLVLAVLATVIGDVLRTLNERNRELEALREVEAREAVAQDRVRIAREVHDVVGHALAGITLQARAGRRLVDRDAQRTGEALRQIDELATRALGETREAIGRIRGDGQPAELRPQPRLDDLDELVARLQEDDLRVSLRREGDTSAVPATVQASAFRILQEALSNVVKHARPASAVVTVAATDGALELDVHDDGRRAPRDDGGGHGVRGMRERAASCGGSLEAGPDPGGGWRVHARLPVPRWSA